MIKALRPKRRGRKCQSFYEYQAKMDVSLETILVSDVGDSTLDRGTLNVLLDILATDHVENHIRTLALRKFINRFDKIFGAIVYDAVSPQRHQFLALFRAASRGDRFCSPEARHLHGDAADSTRSALHE